MGEKLTLELLSEEHRELAEIIGIDNLFKLSKQFGGTVIYIPRENRLKKNTIRRQVVEEFNGTNSKQLSKKYGISYSTVWRILKDSGKI